VEVFVINAINQVILLGNVQMVMVAVAVVEEDSVVAEVRTVVEVRLEDVVHMVVVAAEVSVAVVHTKDQVFDVIVVINQVI
jgi:hypothetical protein